MPIRPSILMAVLAIFLASGAAAQPLGTAFTYQGELASAGVPASGLYDVRFRLYDAPTGGTQVGPTLCSDNLTLAAGHFAASLDFGSVFAGQSRYLEIEVRSDTGLGCGDGSGYTTLSPRQPLAPTPSAIYAASAASAVNATQLNGQSGSFFSDAANLTGTIPSARLSGTYSGALNLTNTGNVFTGSGAGLTSLNATNLSSGTLNAARLPVNWPAGGDLSGFFPSPTIGPGVINRSKLNTEIDQLLGSTSFQMPQVGQANAAFNASAIVVSGSFAYQASLSSRRVDIFNVTNPAAPVNIGNFATATDPYGLAVSGSYAYVANTGSSSLQIINISNPAAPITVGGIATGSHPFSVAVSGSLAYVVSYTSALLEIFDVSIPSTPTRVGFCSTGDLAQSVAISGSYAYVVCQGGSLQVFNIANANLPSLVTSVATDDTPNYIAIVGSKAYVAGSTLQVFSISNPVAPAMLGRMSLGVYPANSVMVLDSRAYVPLQNTSLLRVVSVLNPASPTLLLDISTGSGPASAAAFGSDVCVANQNASMQIFRPSDVRTYTSSSTIFSGTLTASSFIGNATSASNALLLNSQPASFYSDAANLTGSLADARLSANVPLKNSPNAFGNFTNSFAGAVGIATTTPLQALDVNGRISVRGGVIQDGGPTLNSGSDLGLYSRRPGFFMRFVTTGGECHWFSDGGTGTTPLMSLLANGNLGVGTPSPASRLTVAGNASFTGSISKGSGTFKIDHPLDPENKFLYHSFVESPDMMNVYNGNATTGADGLVTITLPDYFDALNSDFRYQISIIDPNAPDIHFVRIASKIGADSPNHFTIKSTPGNLEVSWQVTGIRKDAFANQNRVVPEVDKSATEKGKYLHPDAFGKPADKGIYQTAIPATSPEVSASTTDKSKSR